MVLLAISLLTILAGTLLLARFKKEAAGIIFTIISWFFIVVGCLLFIAAVSGGIYRFAHRDVYWDRGFRHEMMMNRHHPGMPCCPPGMEGRMFSPKPGCYMPHDSAMMKCCPRHMMGDTTKRPPCPNRPMVPPVKPSAPKK